MLRTVPGQQLLEGLLVAMVSQRRKEITGDQPHITKTVPRRELCSTTDR